MKIGVISDTHGYLDPKVLTIFKGVEHILHGGDIGPASLIHQLEEVAPVTAVLGNCDSGGSFPEPAIVELAGRKFLVHHIVDPKLPAEPIRARIAREQPDVVVFGHTHKPFCERLGATLYLNPGSAGKPRFNLPRTVAILECQDGEIRP